MTAAGAEWQRWHRWQPWQLRLQNSSNGGALTVTAVETFALVMVVATVDSNGNGGKNRVSGGSSGNSG
jgi:hypothetical protein